MTGLADIHIPQNISKYSFPYPRYNLGGLIKAMSVNYFVKFLQ